MSGGFGFAGLALAIVSLTTNWTSSVVVSHAQNNEEMRAPSSGLTVQQQLDLSASGFDALEVDGVAGIDLEARRERAIPARMRGGGIECVIGHRTETTIWSSTMALRGRAVTPMAARAWRPASPKTSTSKSDAPLITWGESGNPAMVLT